MVRNHRAAHARRNQLARQRGFPSYSAQRKYARTPSTDAQFKALPAAARERRGEALDVINAARRDGLSVKQVAASRGVPLSAVAWWGQPALVNPASKSPTVRKADRILRYTPLVTADGGVEFVATRGSNVAAKAQAAFQAQRDFLDGKPGSAAALAKFRGVRVGGRLIETDPAVLGEIGRRGELADLADSYRAWVSAS